MNAVNISQLLLNSSAHAMLVHIGRLMEVLFGGQCLNEKKTKPQKTMS